MDKPEEIIDMIFPTGDQPAEVVHPGEQPLDFPTPPVAAQLATVLTLASAPAIGRNHFDSVFGSELLVERVRIISFVPDEPGREFIQEASGKNRFHKLALGRRSAFDRYGERKTVISGDSDDLRALAAAGRANGKAPFLALAKVASTNASSRFSLPCPCRWVASNLRAFSSFPLRTHCWKRRWQVWYGGYLSGNSRCRKSSVGRWWQRPSRQIRRATTTALSMP